MLLALADAAWADTDADADCAEAAPVLWMVPHDGEAKVPIDAQPVVAFGGVPCVGEPVWRVSVVQGDGEQAEVLAGAVVAVDGADDSVLRLVPTRPLPADTVLHFDAVVDGTALTNRTTFTTGDGLAAGLVGAPTLTITSATWATDGRDELVVDGVPAGDPDGMSTVRYELGDTVVIGLAEPVRGLVLEDEVADEPAQLCATMVQIDGRGVEHPVTACATPEIVAGDEPITLPGGCFGGGGSAVVGIAFVGVMRRGRARSTLGAPAVADVASNAHRPSM
jgi:hypothetical protein